MLHHNIRFYKIFSSLIQEFGVKDKKQFCLTEPKIHHIKAILLNVAKRGGMKAIYVKGIYK